MIDSDLGAPAANPGRIGLAMAWAGWGAIAAQRFSSGAYGFMFGALVGGAGIFLVVLTRIQDQRRLPIAAADLRPAPVAQDFARIGPRNFRELAPENPGESDRAKN
ncbi:MAG TPA: hypothetical protein VIM69_03030 [Opitutaceae bacterium]